MTGETQTSGLDIASLVRRRLADGRNIADTDIRRLVAEIDRLRAEVERLEGVVQAAHEDAENWNV